MQVLELLVILHSRTPRAIILVVTGAVLQGMRDGGNDNKIFKKGELKELLRSINKKAIGDRGYNGHPNECSTFNAHDFRGVRKFKSRALKQHENFNNMTKLFDCLSGRFRHGADRFATCFEAVCVICQYQMEDDMPLFEVLIEDIMDD